MTTRLFELSISVPCKDSEAEEAMTRGVEEVSRQLYAMAAMLAWRGNPRIRLTITSSTIGKVTKDVLGDAAREAEEEARRVKIG
jgi:hypothetical protein